MVGNVYKGLKLQQSQLHIKMTDVKSSVSLSPSASTELAIALSIAVQSLLAEQGWVQLDRQYMVKGTFWDLEGSRQRTCQSVQLSIECHTPGNVVLLVQTGMSLCLAAVWPVVAACRLCSASCRLNGTVSQC